MHKVSMNTQTPNITFDSGRPISTPASQRQVVGCHPALEEHWVATEHTLRISPHDSVNHEAEEHQNLHQKWGPSAG